MKPKYKRTSFINAFIFTLLTGSFTLIIWRKKGFSQKSGLKVIENEKKLIGKRKF